MSLLLTPSHRSISDKNPSIDFITCLPYHVLDSIFSKVSSLRYLTRCTRVSKTWRSFLLSWPGLWRDLSDLRLNIARDLVQYERYFDGKHVRVVHILGRSRSEQEQAILFLVQHNCYCIETIRIACYPEINDRLVELFKTTGRSLQSLHVYSGGSQCVLYTVLQHCTALKDLRYSHSTEGFETLSPDDVIDENIPTTTPIQDLSLDAIMSYPLLENTLRLFPCLKRVDLNASIVGRDCGHILEFLATSCPQLQQVQFGGDHTAPAYIRNISTLSSSPPPPAKSAVTAAALQKDNGSIRVLVLSQLLGLSDTHLVPLFLKHGKTLEAIHIEACYTLGDATFSALAMRGCPHLRYLCIRLNCFMYEAAASIGDSNHDQQQQPIHFQPHDLCTFIRNAPSLEEVNFSYLTGVTDPIVEELAELKNLKELEISHCENVTQQSLCRLIIQQQHNSNKNGNNHGRQLKSLHLLGMKGVTDQVLSAIAQYMGRQLESLDVGSNDNITEAGFNAIVDRFSRTKVLKWLGVSHCSKIHPGAYDYACQKLKTTTVYRVNMKPGYNIVLSR
ncbi:hypothetical protein BDB00DRAFT_795303 [Zychaea mexicana]|uniref:uncharacterized protein n=1 Tax=Zychaea mexicana TaxID=64656 RepID=UPI0022FEB9C5|nr:uncharacterized protein BDB00DRAFT_795303 [Zychaea mexicana]KAI9499723.1 hypothetical protein BDB00DRAFT_795303 [Zychaea mexicana]